MFTYLIRLGSFAVSSLQKILADCSVISTSLLFSELVHLDYAFALEENVSKRETFRLWCLDIEVGQGQAMDTAGTWILHKNKVSNTIQYIAYFEVS